MTPVEVLRKAKGLLEERGWTQHVYVDESGCYCVRGACYAAAGCEVWPLTVSAGDQPAAETAQYILGEVTGCNLLNSVGSWNDYEKRTKSQVMAAFDQAISRAEGLK